MYLNISPLAQNSMHLLAALDKELSRAKVAAAMHHNEENPSTSGYCGTDIDSSIRQPVRVDAQPLLQPAPDFQAFDMAMLAENFEDGSSSCWMDETDGRCDMDWFMSMPFVSNGGPMRDLTWSQHQLGNF
jgi:hypothetical protein